MKEQGIGHSHAKIILMGEHSVVYGEPAIALPLPDVTLTVIIKLTNKGGHHIKSRYFEGPLNQLPEKMAGVQRLISSLMQRFNGESDQWTMTIKSQLPAERGMGSSAATAVAIVRAFFDLYEEKLERKQLLHLADIEEEVTHRSPSGLDAATVSSTSPLYFVKGQAGVPLKMNLQATMVIADTGVYGHTREAIQVVDSKGKEALPFLHALGELTKQAEEAIKTKDAVKLGEILTKAHGNLKEIGVSSPEADALVETALEHGALGAKMSGGGLGGCIIALVANVSQAQELAERLEEKGAVQTWIESL